MNAQPQLRDESLNLSSHGKYEQQMVISPDQFDHDLVYGEPDKKQTRKQIYKSKLAKYKQKLRMTSKQKEKEDAERSSKHIEKYRHTKVYKQPPESALEGSSVLMN